MIVDAISLILMKILSFYFPHENISAKTTNYNIVFFIVFDISFLIGISYNIGYIIVYWKYIMSYNLN